MKAEVMRQILILRDPILFMVAMTIVCYIICMISMRWLRVTGKGGKVMGLFVGLGGKSAVLMGIAWVKFAYLTALLILAETLYQIHYMFYIALLLGLVLRPGLSYLLSTILSALLGFGVIVSGALQSYLVQIRFDQGIEIAYWCLTAFLILGGVVLLLREIIVISGERNYFDETEDVD